MAIDPAGNIWVSDVGNTKISKFDKNGNFLFSFGSNGSGPGQFSHLLSLSIDRDGVLYATEYGGSVSGRIQRFDLDGNYLGQIVDSTVPPGAFQPSHVHKDQDGTLWVLNAATYPSYSGSYVALFSAVDTAAPTSTFSASRQRIKAGSV